MVVDVASLRKAGPFAALNIATQPLWASGPLFLYSPCAYKRGSYELQKTVI